MFRVYYVQASLLKQYTIYKEWRYWSLPCLLGKIRHRYKILLLTMMWWWLDHMLGSPLLEPKGRRKILSNDYSRSKSAFLVPGESVTSLYPLIWKCFKQVSQFFMCQLLTVWEIVSWNQISFIYWIYSKNTENDVESSSGLSTLLGKSYSTL